MDVRLKSGVVYTGIFHTALPASGSSKGLSVALKFARQKVRSPNPRVSTTPRKWLPSAGSSGLVRTAAAPSCGLVCTTLA